MICLAKAVVGKRRQHTAFPGYCVSVATLCDAIEFPFEGFQLHDLASDRVQLALSNICGGLAGLIWMVMKFDEL